MTHAPDPTDDPCSDAAAPPAPLLTFELFVQPGFSHQELSSILAVLEAANAMETGAYFTWQITSDSPGLLASNGDMLVRAEPAIGVQYLRDVLFVVGGRNCSGGSWLPRARAMQKERRPAFLLSEAAAEYIRRSAPLSGPVTTHWLEARTLQETGDYPTLSNHLVEDNSGLLTCAGRGHTAELVIRLLAQVLSPQDCAELTSLLVLEATRGFSGEQPKGAARNTNLLEARLVKAMAVMEANVEHPLPTAEIAEHAGVSIRHLERLFLTHLHTTPAKHYMKLRLKLANKLISDTNLPIAEIAFASGFASSTSLARAYRRDYGMTPYQVRARDRGV
ncbi:GlxA family transcriptional regulator [Epibacterium sp. Ofav1-8]|uniref:GlxA family transcriptional regulator n=1 Tax=Epibacterium sp. Ofav1-8 TaxID=2917735 RepID=UPI001EF75111|nr:helix-turn-helix domain-containing protein [Epibacterium sp. Ofav1-8]MCG7624602.1 helix-turn-helix domain-containing protein [Epibacterium sp. Ofav1-8]